MTKMLKKVSVLFFLMFLCCAQFFALSIDTHLSNVEMHPDFWGGMFPSSVQCAADITGFQFIPQRKSLVSIELGTGTLARTITRNPDDGQLLTTETANDLFGGAVFYDLMYASFDLSLSQGFKFSHVAETDLFTASAGVSGRWEIYLDPIMQSSARSGKPFEKDVFRNNSDKVLFGHPDLSGNRQMLGLSLKVSGKLNYLLLKTAVTNGIRTEFEFEWAPEKLNVTRAYGGAADFVRFWFYAKGGSPIYQAKSEDGKNIWSIGFSYDLEMRYLNGRHVPEYAEKLKGEVWWYEPENTTYLIRTTAKLDYFGREFLKTCVPHAYLFFDYSFATGKLNNTKEPTAVSISTGSFGIHVEMKLFDTLSIYYEIGKVFLYTGTNTDYVKGFRSSESIQFKLSLDL